ncbi:hypothetical protein P8C59_006386 [Phyllachora maydis]|uniref:Peptidase S53 domain-containing protein n=1 Tax=Phyllachora maydis TaxID=1825666 RepID=A0AAD9I814_9PEZI|nr:hypothetical protein P8C59_006386 [Phyllachora maydis]
MLAKLTSPISPTLAATHLTAQLRNRLPTQLRRSLPFYVACALFIFVFFHAPAKLLTGPSIPFTSSLSSPSQPARVHPDFPPKIWQVWKMDPLHFDERDHDVSNSWVENNPDYRYEVLTDGNQERYVEFHYGPQGFNRPDIVDFFRNVQAAIVKSDLLRYLVMYAEGGIYADIDVEAIRPLNKFIPDRYDVKDIDMVIGVEIDEPDWKDHAILGSKCMSFCQWTFMCKPQLPVMMRLIEQVMAWLNKVAKEQKVPISNVDLNFDEIISGTGPSAFTNAIIADMNERGARPAAGSGPGASSGPPSKQGPITWDMFHDMRESKLIGRVLVLTVEAFAANQGHSDSGAHEARAALVRHHYHASNWPSRHHRFTHPVYGQVEACNWNDDCVNTWTENVERFKTLDEDEQKRLIAEHEREMQEQQEAEEKARAEEEERRAREAEEEQRKAEEEKVAQWRKEYEEELRQKAEQAKVAQAKTQGVGRYDAVVAVVHRRTRWLGLIDALRKSISRKAGDKMLASTWASLVSAVLAVTGGGLAADTSLPPTHRLHERHLPHWGKHWAQKDRVPGSTLLPMRIGLKQSNLDKGAELLMDISDPHSANYGKHLTADEVTDLFAPSQSAADQVIDWLTAAGIHRSRIGQSVNKQWIQFDARADEVEALLLAEYSVWQHSSGSTDVSCPAYHVPQHVQEHIDYITPGTRMRQRTKHSRPTVERRRLHSPMVDPHKQVAPLPGLPQLNASSCNHYVTAVCVRVQYEIPLGSKAAPGNKLGIFESDDDHYSKADLDVYWSNLEKYIPNGTYPEERLVDGAVGAAETPSDPAALVGAESNLDLQAAQPLIWPQQTVLFQEDDQWVEWSEYNDPDTPYLGFWNTFYDAIDGSYCTHSAYGQAGDCTATGCLDPAYPDPHQPGGYNGTLQCGVYRPTPVISMSYAFGENLLPAAYLRRQCDEVLKLGLQGVTVVASSGDGGVGGIANCPGAHHQIFHPLTPNTCPYVLAVGSTELDRPATAARRLAEVPTRRFGSGGGFSNVFAMPDYQARAVRRYFDTTPLNFTGYTEYVDGNDFANVTTGLYHIGGRGLPDVAAVGDNFLIHSNGSWWSVGGTSVSAPIWGALLTLVNEERLAANMSTLGFVHPLLYAHPDAFTDITTGSNPGCNASYSNGFPAAEGWDPVTGLGTPIYPKLLRALMDVRSHKTKDGLPAGGERERVTACHVVNMKPGLRDRILASHGQPRSNTTRPRLL